MRASIHLTSPYHFAGDQGGGGSPLWFGFRTQARHRSHVRKSRTQTFPAKGSNSWSPRRKKAAGNTALFAPWEIALPFVAIALAMGSFPRWLDARIVHGEENTAAVGGSMAGTPPNDGDPKVIFNLEAETGEVFEISFSLRGILSTVVMAHSWTPLKEELAQLEPPTKV